MTIGYWLLADQSKGRGKMKKILIVGGGMAGSIVANGLARKLNKEMNNDLVEITVISATDQHLYQPGLLYLAFGRVRENELYRNQREILDKRINFHVDPAVNIDADNKKVTTESGKVYEGDYLVIATGSRIMTQSIPGLSEEAHQFYTPDGAKEMRDSLKDFKGGKVVVNVNAPHKCPVAPIEITLMLHDYLKENELLEKSEITYTYPVGRVHAMEPVAKWAAPEFEKLGIKAETLFNTKEVDGKTKTIISEEGTKLKYDYLITIPPHKGAQVVEDSIEGAKGGWCPTDKKKLYLEGKKDVFVCGDTTNIPISKAGSTAHFEADTIIDNISSLIQEGTMARDYDGKVFCFIETGKETGSYVWFNYTTPPNPGLPTKAVHRFKLAYNKMYWLSAKGLL